MIICSKCKAPISDGRCPICSRKGGFVEAADNDFVYLTTVDAVFSNTVFDVLNDNGILAHKKSVKGAGTTVYIGTVSEQNDFYVYVSDYEKAVTLLEEFNADYEDDINEGEETV